MQYVIDVVPAAGDWTPLSFDPGEVVEAEDTVIPVDHLAPGLHTLYVRPTDTDGNVGPIATRSFVVDRDPAEPVDVTGLRVAIDADPRSGRLLPAGAGGTVEFADDLDLSELGPRLHALYVAGTDSMGALGIVAARPFLNRLAPLVPVDVVSMSYSVGSGSESGPEHTLPVPPGQTVEIGADLPLSAVADGPSLLTVRATDDRGRAGIPASRMVVKTPSILEPPPVVDRLRYWVVTETGGAPLVNVAIPIGDRTVVDRNVADALSSLQRGESYHLLVQAEDARGGRSAPIQDDFRFVCLEDLWAERFFTQEERLDPSISGPDADPNRNGIPNRVEIALANDPLSPGLAIAPRTGARRAGTFRLHGRSWHGGTGTPFLDYHINGYHVTMEYATDLTGDHWSDAASILEAEVQAGAGGWLTDLVEIRMTDEATAAGDRYFFRIKVVSPVSGDPFALLIEEPPPP